MIKSTRVWIISALIMAVAAFVFWKIGGAFTARPVDSPAIITSFYPVGYFTQHIEGNDLQIQVLTPGGVEPHDFQPSPQAIASLQKAKVFFYNGAGVDVWASKARASLPASVLAVNVMEELQKQGVVLRQAVPDEEEGEASDTTSVVFLNNDPHVWLDPVLAQKIVTILAEHLKQAYPDHAVSWQARADALLQKLSQLDTDYKMGLTHCRLPEIIAAHDAFGYLGDRYHFAVVAISGLSPEQQPSAKKLAELADLIKQKGIKIVFFETLVSPKLSQTLAYEAGATAAVLNPIEGLTAQEAAGHIDYLAIMQQNLAALRQAMQCQ